MALLTKGLGSIDSTNKKVNITDDTGNYNAQNNTGGYGSPNPERNTRALFVQKYTVDENDEQVVEVEIGDAPLTDSSWEFDYTNDNVAVYALISLFADSNDPSGSIQDGFVYYNTTSNTIRRFDKGWSEISVVDIDDIGKVDESQPDQTRSQKADIPVLVLEIVNDFLLQYYIDNVDSKEIKVTEEDILYLKSLKNSAKQDFESKNYISSHKSINEIVRVLTKLQ